MTRRRSAAATASLIGVVCGCTASTESDSTVTAIDPATAFTDVALVALIRGDSFRPTYHFDTMAASSATDVGTFSAVLRPAGDPAATATSLEGVTWQSPKALQATVPAGVPAGHYDVVVTDPRGRRMQLDGGFTSLGPDTHPPVVTIDAPLPGALIGAGTTVPVTLTADDGDGLLATLGASIATMPIAEITCNVPARTQKLTCYGEFVAPGPTADNDRLTITPYAMDSVGNPAAAYETYYRLAPRPSLIGVSPTVGSASGGTEIVVQGTDFVEGTEILFGTEAVPATWISATEIRALSPSHEPGSVTVKISSGGAASEQALFFEFVAAPIIRVVNPLSGPVTGGTIISIGGNYFRGRKTVILIGGAELLCPVTMGPNRIDGVVPPATNGTGPAFITAADEIGGIGTAAEPFVYDDSPGVPISCDGAP